MTAANITAGPDLPGARQNALYQEDLAYVHGAGFVTLARRAGPAMVRRLKELDLGRPVARVIDAGCGDGTTTEAFVDAGYAVTAIEPSPVFAKAVRARVPRADLVEASLYETPLPKADAVFAIGEVLSYHDDPQAADRRVADFFTRVYEILPPGGLFAFDVIVTGNPDLSGRHWNAGDDWAVLVEITEDRGSRRLVREIETFRTVTDSVTGEALYRRSGEIHVVRLFEAAGLERTLCDLGFEVSVDTAYDTVELATRRLAFTAIRR